MMEHLRLIITREICPKCTGPGEIFGLLFGSVWSRCSHCGCEFMAGHTPKKLEEVESAIKV